MNENNYSREDSIPTRQKWRAPAFNDSFSVTGPDMERFHREGVWAAVEANELTLRNMHGRWVSGRYERGYRILSGASADRPTPCQGCINYYGKTDGGNKLICAIHPSGVEGDTCPDFEQKENT